MGWEKGFLFSVEECYLHSDKRGARLYNLEAPRSESTISVAELPDGVTVGQVMDVLEKRMPDADGNYGWTAPRLRASFFKVIRELSDAVDTASKTDPRRSKYAQ